MSDKEKKIECYRAANKNVLYGKTVFTGSSLMEMFPINKLLKENGDDTIIYNRAVGGFVSAELLEALDTCVLALKPARVFLNIGTNDLSDSRISILQLMDCYDKIVTKIETELPETEIYLMAYYPVNYEAAAEELKACLKVRTNERISQANAEVEKLARKHGQKYIDINEKLKDSHGRLKAEYTLEGLHINEEGYRAVYEDIMAYVKEPGWKSSV